MTQADIDHGSIGDTATASGRPPADRARHLAALGTANVTATQTPGLTVSKDRRSRPRSPRSGRSIAYTFAVTNTGNVTITDLSVTDTESAPAGHLDHRPQLPHHHLAPATAITCTATYTVTQADLDNGSIDDTATATANLPDGSPITSPSSSASDIADQTGSPT